MKNFEFKARLSELTSARQTARRLGARLIGELRQTDIFFPVPSGRLKLRCESSAAAVRAELIFYRRPDEAGPKASEFDLVPVPDPEALRRTLASALGAGVEVRKLREFWILDRTRIHLDTVEELGLFLEIEVTVSGGEDETERAALASRYLEEFGVREADLVRRAYADLLEAEAGPAEAEPEAGSAGAAARATFPAWATPETHSPPAGRERFPEPWDPS